MIAVAEGAVVEEGTCAGIMSGMFLTSPGATKGSGAGHSATVIFIVEAVAAAGVAVGNGAPKDVRRREMLACCCSCGAKRGYKSDILKRK